MQLWCGHAAEITADLADLLSQCCSQFYLVRIKRHFSFVVVFLLDLASRF